MTRRKRISISLLASALLLGGCSLGMQPTGPTVEEINAIRAKWPPEKQIEGINQSPMPPAEKRKRIAEIEQKYHMQVGTTSESPAMPGPPRRQ